jgi:D-alanine-D-alanine ligase-like ATP-grasp enzyme
MRHPDAIVSGLGPTSYSRCCTDLRRGRHNAGLLELGNVPWPGVLASAVGMDKAAMKLVFAAKGLPICDYEVVLKRDWQRDRRAAMHTIVSRLGFPCS